MPAWRGEAAGRALCARHRVRAREYGLVRTCTDLYGRLAQGCVGALCPGNSIAHGCVPCQPSASLLRHVHGVHQRTKCIPSGWQSTLCKAQGAGKGIRTCTDLYGLVRTIGTWLCGCPVPRKFHSTWLRALPAKCLTPAPCAWRSKKSKAYSLRLAKRIAQCRYWGQRMSDLSDLSDLSDDWHRVQSVPCALEFR